MYKKKIREREREKNVSVIYLWKAKYDGILHQHTKLIILQPQVIS